MNLPDLKTPSAKEAGAPTEADWFNRAAAPRDAQLKRITDLLQGLFSVTNANAEIRELTVKDQEPLVVHTTKIRGPAVGAVVLWAGLDRQQTAFWTNTNTGEGTLEVSFNSGPDEPVDIVALLVGN